MRKIFLLACVVLGTYACNDVELSNPLIGNTEVDFCLDGREISGGGNGIPAPRGNAPVFIDGVTINAHHNVIDNDIAESFTFTGNNPDPISMKVHAGENIFSANSLPSFSGGDKVFNEHCIGKATNAPESLKGKYNTYIDYYKTVITEEYPTYAEYSGTAKKTIVENKKNSVDIDLTTDHLRLIMVFGFEDYIPTYKYTGNFTVTVKTGENHETSNSFNLELTDPTRVTAISINNADFKAVNGIVPQVIVNGTVYIATNEQSGWSKEYQIKPFNIEDLKASDLKTVLINISSVGEYSTWDTSFNLNWQEFTNSQDVIDK